jgi:hypothetical protein
MVKRFGGTGRVRKPKSFGAHSADDAIDQGAAINQRHPGSLRSTRRAIESLLRKLQRLQGAKPKSGP